MIDVPDLDSIGFDALVEEGRGLIPRFAPQWTDHNLHDPGITLLDLLAWFVDQQVYRIGFVGEAHLDAFAALLGVTRRGAIPARGLIWANSEAATSAQSLPEGTIAHPLEQPQLRYSVAHPIHLSAARIVRIEARAAAGARRVRRDETGAILLDPDTDSIEITFDGALSAPGAAATVSLGLAFEGALPELGGRAPAVVDYQVPTGPWQRAAPAWTGRSGESAGVLLLKLPPDHGGVTIVRLDLAAGLPRRLLPTRLALNTIPVVQVEELPALKIGEGTGWPDLELNLGDFAVPAPEEGFPALAVTSVRGAEEPVSWQAARDFSRSGPGDPIFVHNRALGTIRFGNGVNGRLAPAGAQFSRSPLHITLGEGGNLAAGAEWTLAGLRLSDGVAFGRNLEPVAGGSDSWSDDDLLAELRRRARVRTAMLTDEEMLTAARDLQGLGVAGAEVLARYWPALPDREVPGARTLLLRAARGIDTDNRWLDAAEAALAPRRVLGERLTVAAVEPVEVDVEAVLIVAAGSDRGRIETEARQAVGDRLAVTHRRSGQSIEPWPSGRPVTAAELETLLARVDGVVAVAAVRLARAGEAAAAVSLPLRRTEVAVAARVELRLEAGG